MKKRLRLCILMGCLLCVLPLSLWADAAGDWYGSYEDADYYVTVAAPDGGVNLRYGPGVDYEAILDSPIPNGTQLHVIREAPADNGNYWGQTDYQGYYGWIALSQVEVTQQEAPGTKTYDGGTPVEYAVEVTAPDGGVNQRSGPGVEYEVLQSMIPNGTVLKVTKEAAAGNGNLWGYTLCNDVGGWIALNQVTKQEIAAPAAQPSVPAAQPSAPAPTQTPAATAAPAESQVPAVTASPKVTSTPTASPVPTASPRAGQTATPTVKASETEKEGQDAPSLNTDFLLNVIIVLCVVIIIAATAVLAIYIRRRKE